MVYRWIAATGTSINVPPEAEASITLGVDGKRTLILPIPRMGPGAFELVEVMLVGRNRGQLNRPGGPLQISTTTMVPWETVEAIAEWVQGDGTDSQRLALADGIRRTWSGEWKSIGRDQVAAQELDRIATCPTCNGNGWVGEHAVVGPCPACNPYDEA